MSPSRTRQPVARLHDRREVVTAGLVSGGIVLGTLLLIWMMRPATPGEPGSGGLMTRQPRVSLLVILTIVTAVIVIWWIGRDSRSRRFSARQLIAFSMVLLLIGASIAAVVWPGGLVREYPSRSQPLIDVPVPTSGISVPGESTTPPTTTAAPTPTTGSP
jgi:hypothetical protein